MAHEFKMIKLHEVPELTEETARLINLEWSRSLEARCHSISNSSDELPCSFLLLKVATNTGARTVVGYSHLSKVLHHPKSVLVESVIVEKALRGCGLGKMIMRHVEEFALKHGYEMVHLSTHDKQSFYEHLGYSLSSPVSPETKVAARFWSQIQPRKLQGQEQTSDCSAPSAIVPLMQSPTTPPPPPPVPPKLKTAMQCSSLDFERKRKMVVWMKKHLSGS